MSEATQKIWLHPNPDAAWFQGLHCYHVLLEELSRLQEAEPSPENARRIDAKRAEIEDVRKRMGGPA